MSDEPHRPVVRTSTRGRVLVVTIDRPEARNAINHAVAVGLERAIDQLEADDDLWVGVLAATPPIFCAGADLKEVAAHGMAPLVTERGGFGGFVRRQRNKPVIAALDGNALGGGLELALAADLIVARSGVSVLLPEVTRSLLAVGGALAELPRLVGEKVALEIALTGTPISVERLFDLGLVNRIATTGSAVDGAVELAEIICANAPLAVRASRRAIVAGRQLDEGQRWAYAEAQLGPLEVTADYAEGLRAFAEKRPPEWTAR
ncbi:enoyl-CoA hydratase-related protein [Rhodococcus sp. IEGM 1354]|uniref:enoyl-CoA hydratase-related protein n=1 Tax=Rhodococcus sp. IEGM 1354 TaxID=3047088 RepID=UPI0024B6A38C|nr:enoyl-CoA hydratase-related protein [Rhodococcus sp. IEGM 1354]MDI9933234.1 enoyl-CoA hydratase-related protein [Rhodococcus sp. IEGM 1354]